MKFVCQEIFDRIIYLLARKGGKLLYFQEQQKGEYIIKFVPYSFQRKTSVMFTNIDTAEQKQSIILHHVLPNSSENVFLRPLLF